MDTIDIAALDEYAHKCMEQRFSKIFEEWFLSETRTRGQEGVHSTKVRKSSVECLFNLSHQAFAVENLTEVRVYRR